MLIKAGKAEIQADFSPAQPKAIDYSNQTLMKIKKPPL